MTPTEIVSHTTPPLISVYVVLASVSHEGTGSQSFPLALAASSRSCSTELVQQEAATLQA